MPRGISNWTNKDVWQFLKTHGFVKEHHDRNPHPFYRGPEGNFVMSLGHGRQSIVPDTLEGMIRQSGIPKTRWVAWARKGKHHKK